MSITDRDLVSELSRLLDARLLGAVRRGQRPTYAVVPRSLFEKIVVGMITTNDRDDQPTYRSPIGPIRLHGYVDRSHLTSVGFGGAV